MIQTRHKFKIEEAQVKMPIQGVQTYCIENSYPLNYSRDIRCATKRELLFTMRSKEDQPYVRYVDLDVTYADVRFTDGSLAMQDIIKRIGSLYNKVTLRLSYTGTIIGIDNIEHLQELWNQEKEYIQSKYGGDQVRRLITKRDYLMSSEKGIIDDLLLYQNMGGLLKPWYQFYNSEQPEKHMQQVMTKNGKVVLDEEIHLKSVEDTGKVHLEITTNQHKSVQSLLLAATYCYQGEEASWLEKSEVTLTERYSGQQYLSTFNITQYI